jgi:hypothetical protein
MKPIKCAPAVTLATGWLLTNGKRPANPSVKRDLRLSLSLRRRRPKGGQLSLPEVSKELAACGFLNELGKP